MGRERWILCGITIVPMPFLTTFFIFAFHGIATINPISKGSTPVTRTQSSLLGISSSVGKFSLFNKLFHILNSGLLFFGLSAGNISLMELFAKRTSGAF